MEKNYKINKNFILNNRKYFIYPTKEGEAVEEEFEWTIFKKNKNVKICEKFLANGNRILFYVCPYIKTNYNNKKLTLNTIPVSANITFLGIYFPLNYVQYGGFNLDKPLELMIQYHRFVSDELNKSNTLIKPKEKNIKKPKVYILQKLKWYISDIISFILL